MRVSELQKQLTDHLAKYGDDYVLVGLRSELESVGQSFKVGPANDKDGSRFALLGVDPWLLLDDKSSAGESSENAETPTNSLQQAIKTMKEENETLLTLLPETIQRIAEKLKETDPEKEGEKKEENHPNSLQQAIKTIKEENETLLSELPAAIRRIAAVLKDGESPDPEKEETEEAESALEKFLKEITSSGPASIQIRVTL